MKKVLLGTTAIIAAGMIAAPAASAKIELSVGGYMEQWVGFSSQDDVTIPEEAAKVAQTSAGVDLPEVVTTKAVAAKKEDRSGSHMVSDSEIFFKGTSELDNGLMVSVEVQLEGNSHGSQIDESFLTVAGSFGELRIGDEDGPMSLMHYGVRDNGIGLNSGDVGTWVTGSDDVTPGPSGTSGWTADAPKVIYYSPRTGGLQFGISYAPGTGEDSNDKIDRNTAVSDSISTGLNYQGDMGGTMLGLSVGYRTGSSNSDAEDKDEDPSALNAGIRVTVGGFGLDMAYLAAEDAAGMTSTSAGVGVSYSQGPMGISLGYQVDENEGDATGSMVPAVDANGVAVVDADGDAVMVTGFSDHAKRETVMLSGSYTLGAGVSLNGSLGTATLSSDNLVATEEVEGTFAVVGVKLSF